MDNLYLLSFEQRILDQPFLRLEDVEVGAVLEGFVEKTRDRSVIVKLAEGITGMIPLEHTADVLPAASKKHVTKDIIGWETRFKEGKSIKCRVGCSGEDLT